MLRAKIDRADVETTRDGLGFNKNTHGWQREPTDDRVQKNPWVRAAIRGLSAISSLRRSRQDRFRRDRIHVNRCWNASDARRLLVLNELGFGMTVQPDPIDVHSGR